MAQRSIPFSTVMVQALRRPERPKTQTRRTVKLGRLRPGMWKHDTIGAARRNEDGGWRFRAGEYNVWSHPIRCPYGDVGDVLLVKESWCVHRRYDAVKPSELPAAAWKSIHWMADGAKPKTHGRTRIGRFLPNARVRDRIEIVGLRAERVKSISEADAIAEGAERNEGDKGEWEPDWGYRTFCVHYPDGCECFPHATAREWFLDLFFNINERASKDADPWVWVIEFRRLPPAA